VASAQAKAAGDNVKSGAFWVSWDARREKRSLEEKNLRKGATGGAVNNSTGGTHLHPDQSLEAEVTIRGSRFRSVSGGGQRQGGTLLPTREDGWVKGEDLEQEDPGRGSGMK